MATRKSSSKRKSVDPATRKVASTESDQQAPEGDSGIEVTDDVGYGEINQRPLAINPRASALELAIGVLARIHRLTSIMEDVSTADAITGNSVLGLACYAEEIVALADAVVERLQAGQQAEASHG